MANDKFYLLEFQFVSFGQFALERSLFYFRKVEGNWRKVESVSDLESVFVESVNQFIREVGQNA